MSKYTTKTAALKATKIDSKSLGAKQIDTKKLFINGELFDPSQIKESPNETNFQLLIAPLPDTEENGYYMLQSMKSNQDGESIFGMEGYLLKGSQTDGALPNGVYVLITIDDNFAKCISGNSLDTVDDKALLMITYAKFMLTIFQNTIRFEQCILENFITSSSNGRLIWAIKICEEDDNLSELYGGITEEMPHFMFYVSIPYYIPENDTSSSTYSLRKTNPIDSLREKFEQMKQQMLNKSAE